MNTFAIGREGCSLVEAEWNSRGLLWAGVLSSVFAPACLQFTFQLRGNLPAPSTCPLCCFQLWDALSSFRSCLWFSMWNMDYFTVSIGHSFKMRVSLFPSLPSPRPPTTGDSLFYENSLVDGSFIRKNIRVNWLRQRRETMETAHWPLWSKVEWENKG